MSAPPLPPPAGHPGQARRFFSTTTAHGFAKLNSRSRVRRLVWVGVCGTAYVCLAAIVVLLTRNFLDPNNTITTLDVQPVVFEFEPDSQSRSNFQVAQDIYPRPVFCQKTKAFETFREIRVFGGPEADATPINASVYATLLRRQHVKGLGNDSYFKVCLRVEEAHQEFQIHWGNSTLPVYVFFQIGKRLDRPLSSHRFKVTRSFSSVELEMNSFERITFRASTTYSTSYPSSIRETMPFYDQGQCLDTCVDAEVESRFGCRRWHRLQTLAVNVSVPLSADDCAEERREKNVLCVRHDFRGNKSGVCGNEPLDTRVSWHRDAHVKCMHLCRPSNVFDYFVLKTRAEEARGGEGTASTPPVTRLTLDVPEKKLTFIREHPKRTLEDLFSDIGGYLSLLVGASVITLGEFIEFVVEFVCRRTKLVRREKGPRATGFDPGNGV